MQNTQTRTECLLHKFVDLQFNVIEDDKLSTTKSIQNWMRFNCNLIERLKSSLQLTIITNFNLNSKQQFQRQSHNQFHRTKRI